MTFMELAAARYSVRKFKADPVAPEGIDQILEAARLAPTAHNSQPQRIKIVTSEEGLAKIDECSPCRYGAPAVVVMCYETRGIFMRPDGVNSGIVDASIVLTHMMLRAQELGVYSCWVMMFDADKIRAAFDIPDNLMPMTIMPIGYPADDYEPNPFHTQRKDTGEYLI